MFNREYGSVGIRVGVWTSRSLFSSVTNGNVVINNGKTIEKVKIVDSKVVEHKCWVNGKYTYWIKYGEFEKARVDGRYSRILNFSNRTGKGLHGLTMRDTEFTGQKGKCYTFYNRGRFTWQKFVYSNGRIAYNIREKIFRGQVVKGRYRNGQKMFEIECPNGFGGRNLQGYPFLTDKDATDSSYRGARANDFSKDGNCTFKLYDSNGRIKSSGRYENKQRVGEWIEQYRHYFYQLGVPVPKKMFEQKPEQIDTHSVLRIRNQQAKAMMLKKVGLERVVSECKGKVIHETGDMRLYDFPIVPEDKTNNDSILRILQVKCPTTKNNYFLKIPPTNDFNTCEKARQGTFNGFELNAKEIAFAVET